MKLNLKKLITASVISTLLIAAYPRDKAEAHPVALLAAIASLIALSDLHWPYADAIMETLNPFCEQDVPRRAWLEIVEGRDRHVDLEIETKKMAAMVRLYNRLKGWSQSHGCTGKIPPYSSRLDTRAEKFCDQTDTTVNGVCGLINEKIGLMEHARQTSYVGLAQGPCQFNERFKLQ